jgi:AAA domain
VTEEAEPRVAAIADEDEVGRYDGQFRPEFSRLHEDKDLLWVTPLAVRYVVGVVGYRSAGKSTVLSYLADKRNFDVYTLSTLVREAAEERGLRTNDRDTLQRLGDELRAEHREPGAKAGQYGDGAYFARLLLRRLHGRYHTHHFRPDTAPRIAISGFKHPDELKALSNMRNFTVFLVDARDEPTAGTESPQDATGLSARAYRAYVTGTLARELGASRELQALASELAPPPLNAEPDPALVEKATDAFTKYLDSSDRDAPGRPGWVKPYAQGVDRVVDCADQWLADKAHPVVRLRNGLGTKLNDLQSSLDAAVSDLDYRYRARQT